MAQIDPVTVKQQGMRTIICSQCTYKGLKNTSHTTHKMNEKLIKLNNNKKKICIICFIVCERVCDTLPDLLNFGSSLVR